MNISELVKTLRPRSPEESQSLKEILCAIQDGIAQFVEFATRGRAFSMAKDIKEDLVECLSHGRSLTWDALEEALQIHRTRLGKPLSPQAIGVKDLMMIRRLQRECLSRQKLAARIVEGS